MNMKYLYFADSNYRKIRVKIGIPHIDGMMLMSDEDHFIYIILCRYGE